MNYLFKNKQTINGKATFLHPTINISPLVDIFTFIIVIIETYLKLNNYNYEEIMNNLEDKFGDITKYRKFFGGIINRYINIAILIYNFYNRNLESYAKQWTYKDFKDYVNSTNFGRHRFNIVDVYKFEEYEHLIRLINILLKNDCMIEPNNFVIMYEVQRSHDYGEYYHSRNTDYEQYASTLTGYEQPSTGYEQPSTVL
jgi:hypothetical protein